MRILRFINYIVIVVAFCLVLFLSASFYLGTQESLEILKEEMLLNFIGRFAGFSILSLVMAFGIWLFNWLLRKVGMVSVDKAYPLKIAKTAFLVLTTGALIGTAVFFFN
ncbi:hypothetical protein [Botryobacter ruber]|uniref:hypothetical protein n=1 Tax=Botryobacter ruber TaxID=2171629 RepID=UPI000E0CB5CF|nr:hypothetical protein [Botryobacter ruber]